MLTSATAARGKPGAAVARHDATGADRSTQCCGGRPRCGGSHARDGVPDLQPHQSRAEVPAVGATTIAASDACLAQDLRAAPSRNDGAPDDTRAIELHGPLRYTGNAAPGGVRTHHGSANLVRLQFPLQPKPLAFQRIGDVLDVRHCGRHHCGNV